MFLFHQIRFNMIFIVVHLVKLGLALPSPGDTWCFVAAALDDIMMMLVDDTSNKPPFHIRPLQLKRVIEW